MILVDSNVLVRLAAKSDPQYRLVNAAVVKLVRQQYRLAYTLQNVAEAWVVLTRPVTSRGGYGFNYAKARKYRDRLHRTLVLLEDRPEVYDHWMKLVDHYQIVSVNAHEARIVATMQVHGVTRVLTFNVNDFKRYQHLEVLTPQGVLAS